MEPNILLAQLRALIERSPNLQDYSPTSRDHVVWLGQAHALVTRWNPTEDLSFRHACDSLSMTLMRDIYIANILGTLHRAIADLELQVPSEIEVGFGSGDVYNFFKALNKVIASAEKSLLIVDP